MYVYYVCDLSMLSMYVRYVRMHSMCVCPLCMYVGVVCMHVM